MNHIKHKFNKSAQTYDKNNKLQIEAGIQLINLITQHTNKANTIIDLGCGTGKTTQLLLNQIHHQKCYALDISESSLSLATTRLPKNTTILQQDFNDLNQQLTKFDLIFANLSLHWSNNIEKSLNIIAQTLDTHGYFAFTIPLKGTLNTLNEINPEHKHAFHTCSEFQAIIEKTKLNLLYQKTHNFTYSFNTPLQALKSLQNTGTNQLPINNSNNMQILRNIRKFINKEKNKPYELSYKIGFFILSKYRSLNTPRRTIT